MSRSLIISLALLCVVLAAPVAEKKNAALRAEADANNCVRDAARLTRVPAAIKNSGQTTLYALLQTANLIDALNGNGPFTVFAPSNAAIANSGLLGDDELTPARLTYLLTYHVLAANVRSTDLPIGVPQQVPTLAGATVTVLRTTSGITVNGYAVVTAANVAARNGVVHVIDHVLIPPCGNVNSLPNITRRGEIEGFTKLVDLGKVRPEIFNKLSNDGQVTLFAPPDGAFSAISGVVAGLTDAQITQVLKYHIVNARVLASDLPNGVSNPTTWLGQTIQVTRSGGNVFVKGAGNPTTARVVAANVQACNGIIHVVDQVLIPTL